jgi:hypothetical protein
MMPYNTPIEKRLRHRKAWKRSYEKHKHKYHEKRRADYRKAGQGAALYREKRRILQVEKSGRQKPKHCDVCGDDTVRIEFDHCHRRGIFRGWLCTHCNVILGHARDNPDTLRKLIAYLERTKILISPQLTLPGI